MTEPAAFTRRRFIHSGLAIVSTAATVPTFLHQAAVALGQSGPSAAVAQRPGVPEDRILVVVQLSGGNDGLNCVVPFGHDAYYRARPRIGVPQGQVISLEAGQGIGLHPQMTGLKQMFDQGLAAIVQGVGYPNPNRSHFASMDIWHSGDTLGGRGHGWLGKAMDQVAADHPMAMVAIGRETPLASEGRRTRAVSFENASVFGFSGGQEDDRLQRGYRALNRQQVPERDDSPAAFVRRTALNAQVSSDRIRRAVAQGPVTSFPGGQLAGQLRLIAAMIRAELPTRVYYAGLGGFDTHANQVGRHQNILGQFAQAMRAFYSELKAIGQDGRVLSMAFSEFGRRVAENASGGTDHGAAGPAFVFGPMIRPGLLGAHPSLEQLDRGDLVHTVDFRCLYSTILDQWLKADSKRVLGKRYQHAALLS